MKRRVFLQRYWYLMPIKEVSGLSGMSESQIKSILFRIRRSLKLYLEKEGIEL